MKLLRFSKKNHRTKILGDKSELDIRWASGPGFWSWMLMNPGA